jgi:hypothetical protein
VSTGAYSAPIFHIRKEAVITLKAVRASHSKCAGPKERTAKGTKNGNPVGGVKILRFNPPAAGGIVRTFAAFNMISSLQFNCLIGVAVIKEASSAIVDNSEIKIGNESRILQGESHRDKYHDSQQQ